MSASDVEQWDGEGLPPVGTVCETVPAWHKATIVGHHKGENGNVVAVYFDHHLRTYEALKARHFRPIRSDEDRAVEEMMRVMMQDQRGVGIKRFAELLYRAGYRKTEDDA